MTKDIRKLEKEVEQLESFLSELRDFADKLRRAANLHLDPDLNDGVVLNIAPLWELAPWKEVRQYWEELQEGKYDWSHIAYQLWPDRVKELCKREQSAADLSDGTLRFLFLLTVLASPTPAPVIAIDEPETGLHPSMLPVIAEYAVDAAQRAQVILTTHSPQFLDAFGDTQPTTTVVKWVNGETQLRNLSGEKLSEWLKEYSLGALFQSGELEAEA